MPIRMKPVKFDKDEDGRYKNAGGFKYDVVRKSTVHTYEEFPKHFLGDTIEEAESLYKEFAKDLNKLSFSYAIGSGLDKADLFGEALIGLARAKRDFDAKRGGKFRTFAIYKIKDALEEHVRKFSAPVILPAYIRRAQKIIYKLTGLLHSGGVEQEKIEMFLKGHIVDTPRETIRRSAELLTFLKNEAERAKISLAEIVERAKTVPHVSPNVDEIESDDRREEKMYAKLLVDDLKSHMSEKELKIAELIMKGKTFEEIGKEFDRSDAWVAQQLEKMRERLKKKIKI